MLKAFCDNCKREASEIRNIVIDIFDVKNPRTKVNDHERYNIDLCPLCHSMIRKIIQEETEVEPLINPYG